MGCSSKLVKGPSLNHGTGDIELKLTKEVFDNGLTVILVENRKLPLFSLHSFVRVGGRDEGPGMTGASHYLEHLMFKGSKNYKAGEFEKIIIGNGGSHNAYTSRDLTVYHESLPITALDKILALEADRLFHLLIEKESFEREKQVILEERKFRTENSPRGQLFLEAMKLAYRKTPYAHPPIGSIEDIKGVTQEQIRDHFETYYDPANIVLVLAGDFDRSKMMRKVRKAFARVKSRGKFQRVPPEKKSDYNFSINWKRELRKKNLNLHGNAPLPLFLVAYPSFPKGHPLSFATDILGDILGGGKSSYLAEQYVHGRRPLLSGVSGFNYDMQKAGLLMFTGQLLKGKNFGSFSKKLKKDLRGVCDRAISHRQVQKVKNKYLVSYFKSFETNGGLCELVGKREVYYGDPLYFKKELEKYLSVTTDEIRGVCETVIEGNVPIVASVWNGYKKEKRR